MSEIDDLTKKIIAFRDARDWRQFHNPKDIALSLMLESAELAEHFQWKNEQEIKEYIDIHKTEVGEEIADVFYWILLLGHDLGINLRDALSDKIGKNEQKYPVGKARSKHSKYNQL